MLDANDERWINYKKELDELTDRVLDLESRTTKEQGETLRAVLETVGYDVKNYGSYYPLILIAIRDIINPN